MISRGTCRTALAPLLAATLAVAPVPDAAAFEREDIACELEDMTRLISLRVDPDAGYVCDVLYRKPDEGDTREVLWSARNSVDYCKPRFEKLVKGLASRGWTCGYADESVDVEGQAAADGAQEDARTADDETDGDGTRGRFRDWCVADVAGGGNVEGAGSVRSYCDCVAGGMDSQGMTEDDARVIFEGLAALADEEGDGSATSDKRLNTLATNYEAAVESCR